MVSLHKLYLLYSLENRILLRTVNIFYVSSPVLSSVHTLIHCCSYSLITVTHEVGITIIHILYIF